MATSPASPATLPPFAATWATAPLSRAPRRSCLLHLLGEALRELRIELPDAREVRSSQRLRGRWLAGGWSPVRSRWLQHFDLCRGRRHWTIPRGRRTCYLGSEPEEEGEHHEIERHDH